MATLIIMLQGHELYDWCKNCGNTVIKKMTMKNNKCKTDHLKKPIKIIHMSKVSSSLQS